MFTINRWIVFVLALAAVAHSSNAQPLNIDVGGKTLTITAPAGLCRVDETHWPDKLLVQSVRAAKTDAVVLDLWAQCLQLLDFRAGRRLGVDEFVETHIETKWKDRDFSGHESEVVAEFCKAINLRKEILSAQMKNDDLGVVRETPNACYSGFFRLNKAGRRFLLLNVHTVLNGKFVEFVQQTEATEGAIDRLLGQMRPIVEAHIEANPSAKMK
jgi:hypothetical protein